VLLGGDSIGALYGQHLQGNRIILPCLALSREKFKYHRNRCPLLNLTGNRVSRNAQLQSITFWPWQTVSFVKVVLTNGDAVTYFPDTLHSKYLSPTDTMRPLISQPECSKFLHRAITLATEVPSTSFQIQKQFDNCIQ
jgi:hypothetical protein